jgi:predicted DNA binding CopG/RHH family protein
MPKRTSEMPKFKNQSAEADWWASPAGRAYVRRNSAEAKSQGLAMKGSSLVAALNKNKPRSVQIALRLPAGDLEQARKIADRKGIGYQTLVKILVHEGLAREARRR